MEPSIVISLSLKPSMQIKPFFAVEPAPVYQLTAKRNSTCVQLSWRHRQTRRDKVYRVDFRRGVETEWQVSCSVTCTLDVGRLLSVTCTLYIGRLRSVTCTCTNHKKINVFILLHKLRLYYFKRILFQI